MSCDVQKVVKNMRRNDFIILHGSRHMLPIDKGDVIIARVAVFAVKAAIFIMILFCAILAVIF